VAFETTRFRRGSRFIVRFIRFFSFVSPDPFSPDTDQPVSDPHACSVSPTQAQCFAYADYSGSTCFQHRTDFLVTSREARTILGFGQRDWAIFLSGSLFSSCLVVIYSRAPRFFSSLLFLCPLHPLRPRFQRGFFSLFCPVCFRWDDLNVLRRTNFFRLAGDVLRSSRRLLAVCWSRSSFLFRCWILFAGRSGRPATARVPHSYSGRGSEPLVCGA